MDDVVGYFPRNYHGHRHSESNVNQRVQAIWLRANTSYIMRPSVSQQRKMRAKIEGPIYKQGELVSVEQGLPQGGWEGCIHE